MMSSPAHTPTDIQSHLYLSLLKGYTADVALNVKGADWEVIYHLHRVVLIQAGFFRSLFTAGFLESNRRNTGAGSAVDEVHVYFDDVNITRAAFELCIARLYGGGPILYLSPLLVPTNAYPLTPLFKGNQLPSQCPPGHHPATPRFLLSLLATSIYLSIPSIISQALSLIVTSVGPYTIIRYLNFAMGNGIGPSNSDDPECAVGLEGVGRQPHRHSHSHTSSTAGESSDNSSEVDVSRKLGLLDFCGNVDKDGSSPTIESIFEKPTFNYGGIGDKIGEVCACWLVRWAADILQYEESHRIPEAHSFPPGRICEFTASRTATHPAICPTLWGKGGLTASWICTIISSNDFFIKGEWERYTFATRVFNLRGQPNEDEEKSWTKLFLYGIHYCHMSFEELAFITKDVSPVTGRPYVSTEVIYASHWTQTLLRQRIFVRPPLPNTSSPSSPGSRYKDLGITLTTANILSTISDDPTSDIPRTKPFYPVPGDSSQRIGDVDNRFASASVAAERLLGNPAGLNEAGQSLSTQSNFFGILMPRLTADKCIQADATGKARWSPFPPFRFAVEYWGVEQIPEKTRLYSHTIWYAGSLFNVYVQVVRKKGTQLGIYLQRQSSVEAPPRPSIPPVSTRGERILNSIIAPAPSSPLEFRLGHRSHSSSGRQIMTGSPASVSNVAYTVPGSPPPTSSSGPSTLTVSSVPSHSSPPTPKPPSMAHSQPYRDPRAVVSVYFIISSVSLTGSCLTRFNSSPDQFTIGQSWGWKSSSLQPEDSNDQEHTSNAEYSLRATVVIGLV